MYKLVKICNAVLYMVISETDCTKDTLTELMLLLEFVKWDLDV